MLGRLPLRYSVPAGIFVIGLAAVVAIFQGELARSYDRVEQDARAHVRTLGTFVAADIEASLRNGEDDLAGRDFERLISDRDLRIAVLLDENNDALMSTVREPSQADALARLLEELELFERTRVQMSGQISLVDDAGCLVSTFPVLLRPHVGELLSTRTGLLVLMHELHTVRAHARSEALLVATERSVYLGVLCFLLALFLHRGLFRRIQRLVDATERIAAGDFNVRMRLKGNDELARLSESLDTMATRLRTHTRELAQNEEHFRTLIEKASDMITIIDTQGTVLFNSPSIEFSLGYSTEELVGSNVFEIVHTDDHTRVAEALEQAFKNPGEPHKVEYRMRRRDGRWRNLESIGRTIADDSRGLRIVVNSRDITERKETENELSRLAMAVEQSAELIMMTDVNGLVQYTNPAFAETIGYPQDRFIGYDSSELEKGVENREFFKNMRAALERGDTASGRIAGTKADGSAFLADATITPLRNAAGKLISYVTVLRDVTHEVQLETQLRRGQKLESIGTLAGGIAHDFNNSLAAILGFTELAQRELEEGSTARNNLEQAICAANRSKDLVQQILTFSRQVETEPSPVHMYAITNECLKLLRATIPSTIEIVECLDPEAGTVYADPTQIHQVIMNLCTNAFHAMEREGGRLEVILEALTADEALVASHPGLDLGTKYVELVVSDTGHGMDRGTLERMFDPFFTTKRQGKGTGLGLATVHGIVTALDGEIRVASEPGRGTTFAVFLPAYEIVPECAEIPKEELVQGRGERILLVDDEKFIVEFGSQLLEAMGYEVVTANSGIDALNTFEAEAGCFDIILSDQIMPGMTGTKLAEALHARSIDVPVIIMTGFSQGTLPDSNELPNLTAVIYKPFSRAELGQVLRLALESRSKA